jgi:CPA2 family monovalent cation:H+ antiporter-2
MAASSLDPTVLKPALIVLGAAAVVIPLFHRLKLSPVLGFILVGLVVGPFGAGRLAEAVPWVTYFTLTETEAIGRIADLGVIFLMFMIGLEMPLQRLIVMRRFVFLLGPAQLVLCTAVVAGGLMALGMKAGGAVVLGLGLAMSSTAVVMQVLSEGQRMGGLLGRGSLGVLLFQDLAAVPILLVVGLMGREGGSLGDTGWAVALTMGKAVAGVAAILVAGRLVLRPLFRGVARTGSPDLFVAACLLVALGTSLAAAVADLTPALGALVAGLVLAETEFRRQVEVTIEPFKGLLIGVFLIAAGMALDVDEILARPAYVLGLVLALVAAKAAIITALLVWMRLRWPTALHAALLLGPAGEFGFVIIGQGMAAGVIGQQAGALALIMVALGLAAVPGLGALGHALERQARPRGAREDELPRDLLEEGAPRVIIAGYGRVGQMVGRLLEVHRIPFIALDADADEVALLRRRSGRDNVFWGDITSPDMLERLHLRGARALVVTMADPDAVDALVSHARRARPDLQIIARARDARHAAHLYGIGATDAVPETIEASLQLAEAVLVDVGVPMGPVIASIHEARDQAQQHIRAMNPTAEVRPLGRRRLRDAAAKAGGDG